MLRRPSAQWTGEHRTEYYEEIGGFETFRRIVAKFYEGVAGDEVLRPLYPEEDLGPAEERFLLFLVQYWGGPTTYSEHARPPPAADAARAVRGQPEAKDHWLLHFRAGLDSVDADPGAGRPVLGLRDPRRPVHGQLVRVSGQELGLQALAQRRVGIDRTGLPARS